MREPQHLATGHGVDPCRASKRVDVPDDFARYEAGGVTVAWSDPTDIEVEPEPLAGLVAGLLERAASLTGTERRESLSVVVYPTREEYFADTGAPPWAGGVYDGAVRLPPRGSADFPVRVMALRHEVMHAQLHESVGCMPLWLHEGAAMYFANRGRPDEWLELLRAGEVLPFERVSTANAQQVTEDGPARVYAQSLAMVLFLIDQPDIGSVAAILAQLQRQRQGNRIGLWSRLVPEAAEEQLLDWLGNRLFENATEPPWRVAVQGSVCCRGYRIGDISCHPAAPNPGIPRWLDNTLGRCSSP